MSDTDAGSVGVGIGGMGHRSPSEGLFSSQSTQKHKLFHSYSKILIFISCLQLGARLIELLLDSAFVQSPADQTPDSSPDIRPAFKHVLRQPIIENG